MEWAERGEQAWEDRERQRAGGRPGRGEEWKGEGAEGKGQGILWFGGGGGGGGGLQGLTFFLRLWAKMRRKSTGGSLVKN